jgi:hypothetical protein
MEKRAVEGLRGEKSVAEGIPRTFGGDTNCGAVKVHRKAHLQAQFY